MRSGEGGGVGKKDAPSPLVFPSVAKLSPSCVDGHALSIACRGDKHRRLKPACDAWSGTRERIQDLKEVSTVVPQGSKP